MKGYRIAIRAQRDAAVEEFDVPRPAGPDGLLVRIHYSLISPGTELGGYNAPNRKAPSHPGYTGVGEVLEVGNPEDEPLVGRMVYLFPEKTDSSGCHASHKLFKRAGLALPLPDGLDPKRACFSRMVNIALTPYCNATPKTMGAVLVIGLGMVGNMIGQVGRIRGFRAIGVELDAKRRQRALEVGFDAVIDPEEQDPLAAVRALTDGRGADLTVHASGHAAPFLFSLRATASGGEVSTLGGARHDVTERLSPIINEIHTKHLVVRGGWEMLLPLRSAPAERVASTEMNLHNAFRWIRSGAVKLDPIWTHTIKPDEFKDAYDALNDRDEDYLGVIVDWTEAGA